MGEIGLLGKNVYVQEKKKVENLERETEYSVLCRVGSGSSRLTLQ